MIINPGVSYSTPLDRGSVLAVSFGAQYVDGDYAEYYYSVTDEQSAASGLPVFDADSGWHKVGVTLALGFDLSGNVRDGGWVAGGAIGYRRMLGDAADTPFTSLRGDADPVQRYFRDRLRLLNYTLPLANSGLLRETLSKLWESNSCASNICWSL